MAEKTLRMGVIGCGEWGPNLIRSFFFHPETSVVRICDRDASRLQAVSKMYPMIEPTQDATAITRAGDIDAVVVATPVSTHFDLVREALQNGKDVLCEKPLTLRAAEARELTQLARKRDRILMVGHVFLFNPGITELKEIIRRSECGKMFYLYARRTNLGPVRKDVNAVFDLASHDISIFNFLLDALPLRVVSASGKCFLQEGLEDVAFVSLEYPDEVMAHIHVSWLDPRKVREITVVGDRKMATWNDLAPAGPIQIFSKRIEREPYYSDYGEFHLRAKGGDIVVPSVTTIEPLKLQTNHFVASLQRRAKPLCDGEFAGNVVEILEQIDRHLEAGRK